MMIIAGVILSSCNKGNHADYLMKCLADEKPDVIFATSDYQKVVTHKLEKPDEKSPYNTGVIEYRIDNIVVATYDFGKYDKDYAGCSDEEGEDKKCGLKKDCDDFKKVIIEPLVQPRDCDYIVAGIIKYYDMKSGKWIATFDFGDGACDPYVEKTTYEGVYTFSMDDYPEFWK